MSDVKIEGLREFGKLCRELPIAVGKHVMARAVAPAAKLIRDEAIMRAPVDTGRLEHAILMKKIPSDRPDVITTYIVAVRHGKKFQAVMKGKSTRPVNLDAYYWSWLEFGTAKMAARPFMRPAFEMYKNQALHVMVERLAEGVDAQATKLAWNKQMPTINWGGS